MPLRAEPSPRSVPRAPSAPDATALPATPGADHADATCPLARAATPDPARLLALLHAQREITEDLSVTDVLTRVVATACELAGAVSGGLGVLAPDGTLDRVVTHGVADPTPLDGIPRPRPALFASVTADGTVPSAPVRVADVREDARTHELHRRRPEVRSFLGVPIRHRGELVGEMYLVHPAVDHFSDVDEEIVAALAASAGSAIANARLYEELHRSHEWLSASNELSRALLSGADDDMLLEVVHRALAMAQADAAVLVLPTRDGAGLRVARGIGAGVADFVGYEFGDTRLSRLIAEGQSVIVDDLTSIVRPEYENAGRFGPFMVVPMTDAQGVRGSILLTRDAARVPFTAHDLDLATGFATQVALALELNDARNDAAWMRILEVRHEIAQSLHDNVIQRLFAVGMGLHGLAEYSAAARALPPEMTERLDRYVRELDDTIVEVRERVFGLRRDARERRRSGRFPRFAGRATTPPPAPPAPATAAVPAVGHVAE